MWLRWLAAAWRTVDGHTAKAGQAEVIGGVVQVRGVPVLPTGLAEDGVVIRVLPTHAEPRVLYSYHGLTKKEVI